ncbi:MAG TPA: LamG domain-containing protein, partial [Verrucomicrobiae bacterium]|nr:LamG domain-containing protein [Verrucomicrobiae bacterium]
SGLITPVGVGTANLTGVYHYVTGATTNTYTASTAVTVVPNPPTTLMHRYSFNDGTANDSAGHANGTLAGNTTVSGGELVIPNSTAAAPATDYLQLPPGILTNAINGIGPNYTVPAATIEAWASFAPNQYTWANLFDFGTQDASGFDSYSISFCVNTGGSPAGVNDAAISDGDNANVDRFNTYAGPSLAGNTNVHLVVVFNPPANYTAFYTNGDLMGFNSNVTLSMAGINATRNLIGADNWPDSGLQGSVDEFRIYNGALTTNEIAATQILGPDQLLSSASPALNASLANGNLKLTWPLAAAGFTLMSRTNLVSGAWSPVSLSPQIVGGEWKVTLPISARTQFFRLQE